MSRLRFAVVGEGRDEHGYCDRGPNGSPLEAGDLRGSLVTLVVRILEERLGRIAEPVRWLVPVRANRRRPAPTEMLKDEGLLGLFLVQLLQPVSTLPESPAAPDFVVLASDGDHRIKFERAVDRVSQHHHPTKVLSIVFEPELEVLFLQGKEPLEDALGLPRCSSGHPAPRAPDSKSELKRWLSRFGPNATLDARLRERIASKLDLSDHSPLVALPSYRQLLADLEPWRP